jgi:hypothetical protein
MPDRPSKAPTRVTVEDLLRLKRAERPQPEFWAEFEQGLRQRQLAALVERKPWWNGLSVLSVRFGWLRLPVGATAVLALTLISVRQYSYSDSQSLAALRKKEVSNPATLPAAPVPEAAKYMQPAESAPAASAEERVIPKNSEPGGAMTETPQEAPREIAAPVSHEGEFGRMRIPSEQAPLSDPLSIQLTAANPVEPTLIDSVVRPMGFEDRSVSTPRPHRTAEVLPTAVAVTEQRCARLLEALGSAGTYAPEPSAPEHAKHSVIRYLAEDGWDRSMSRLQADGDRLSIRF